MASGRSRKIKSTHHPYLQIYNTQQVSCLAADVPESALREQFSNSQVENYCSRRMRRAGVNLLQVKPLLDFYKHGNGAIFTVAGKTTSAVTGFTGFLKETSSLSVYCLDSSERPALGGGWTYEIISF